MERALALFSGRGRSGRVVAHRGRGISGQQVTFTAELQTPCVVCIGNNVFQPRQFFSFYWINYICHLEWKVQCFYASLVVREGLKLVC